MGIKARTLRGLKWVLGDKRYLQFRTIFLDVVTSPIRLGTRTIRLCQQLMRVDLIRACILTTRYFFLVRIFRRLKIYQNPSESVSPNTIRYNLTAFRRPLLLHRTRVLLRPLTVIETLAPNSSILIIGPRSEDDLLHLSAYGFQNVRGLDLISYSPRVDLGDMHQLPYSDSTFDVVLYGWVLVYSVNPRKAAREALRVIRDGGIVGIGAEHHPDYEASAPNARAVDGLDYPVGGERINSAERHLDLFRGHVKHLFFIHDVGAEVTDRMSDTCVIFSVRKDCARDGTVGCCHDELGDSRLSEMTR